MQILRRRWWKYLLLGLVDVEANYAVVKAYQYTTLTSVQVGEAVIVCVRQVGVLSRKHYLEAGQQQLIQSNVCYRHVANHVSLCL